MKLEYKIKGEKLSVFRPTKAGIYLKNSNC